jgi:hypothetical protein
MTVSEELLPSDLLLDVAMMIHDFPLSTFKNTKTPEPEKSDEDPNEDEDPQDCFVCKEW